MKDSRATPNKEADTSAPARRAEAIAQAERELVRHVYALYGLTPAEIKLVEESSAPKTNVT